MSLSRCTRCGASCAVDLDACPQCEGTLFIDATTPTAWTCQAGDCRAQWKLKLLECPRCHGTQMRLEKIDMPHITVHGGPNIPGEPAQEPAAPPAAPVAEPAPAEVAPPAEAPSAEPAARPSVNAPKAAWVAWAVERGLTPSEAEAMTKEQLRAREPAAPAEGTPAAGGPRPELTITAEADVTRGEL